MSDPETRDEITDVIKEACPLRTVLTKKPCPYFGASKSCLDCTYDWVTVAASVRKVAENRRASYEREREKVKQLTAELESQKSLRIEMVTFVRDTAKWLRGIDNLIDRVEEDDEDSAEEEEVDAGQNENKSPAGEEG